MSIYKECDIRGVFEEDLNESEALLIGKAIGSMIDGRSILVGGDTRYSTDPLKRSLIEGLLSTGSDVIDIGTVPTPVTYFSKRELGTYAAVMVTASHNPAEYNGFKLLIADTPVTEKDIQQIQELVRSQRFREGKGQYTNEKIIPRYLQMILSEITRKRKLSIVVDCGNGAASVIALQLFEELGYDVVPQFCEPMGNFPHRDPNPSVEEHVTALKERVIREKADLGIAFDGDGDRVVFVDDAGRYCDSEAVFLLLINHYMRDSSSENIVYDGKSSSIVKKGIEKAGAHAIPERSGHAFIRKRFLEENALLAGEVSGHFFFRELGYDDGLYAALRMCEFLSGNERAFSDLLNDFEAPLITPDIRIYENEEIRKELLSLVENKGREFTLSYLDGVRLDTPYSWIVIRKSVTEPCVTIRMEADTLSEGKKFAHYLFSPDYPEIESKVVQSLILREEKRKRRGMN